MSERPRSGKPLNPGKQLCVNCGTGTAGHLFQGVIICDSCKAVVDSFVRQAEQQLQNMRTTLLESVRVALLERKFGAHKIPGAGTAQAPTKEDVQAALERMFQPLTHGTKGV